MALTVGSSHRGNLAIDLGAGLDAARPILAWLLVGLLTVATLFLARAHRLGKEALVMLRVLEEALGRDRVVLVEI